MGRRSKQREAMPLVEPEHVFLDAGYIVALRRWHSTCRHLMFSPRPVQSGTIVLALCQVKGRVGKPGRYLGDDGLFWSDRELTAPQLFLDDPHSCRRCSAILQAILADLSDNAAEPITAIRA